MDTINLSAASGVQQAIIAHICADAGVNLKDCYQCGKCAAGCPVASTADINCRQVIRLLQLGQLGQVLAARMPWLCVGCATCVTRCPQSVNMPALNEAICRFEMTTGAPAVKEGATFERQFLDTVQKKGVNDEVLFAMNYNLSSGHLFQDVANSPRMLTRGLLSGDGYKPGDAADVRTMVASIRANTTSQAKDQLADLRDAAAQGGDQ